MRAIAIIAIFFNFLSSSFAQQSLDAPFAKKDMKEDLVAFRQIRETANSGLYKYRSKQEIDSLYQWAEASIEEANTYLDFYNILWHLSDFEGSLHNNLFLPQKVKKSLREETSGYFPYPIKLIEGKLRVNFENEEIPLGSEITAINGIVVQAILPNLYKYYSTDGFNITGKSIGINEAFSFYYRLHYGRQEEFLVAYTSPDGQHSLEKKLYSSSLKQYFNCFDKRHSAPYDAPSFYGYAELEDPANIYSFEFLSEQTAKLTIHSFAIGGNAESPMHIAFTHFLDSVFSLVQERQIVNLIVDVRHNGGGSDPNDMVTYAYLTGRNFVENTEAWVSFNKIPYWKYVKGEVSFIRKPIEKIQSDRSIQRAFPIEKDGRFYQNPKDQDQTPRMPQAKAFTGKVYLMISPRVASAGSMFAAMVAGNSNTVVVGSETQGGYYGHNGHIPIRYQLPNSKVKTMFSIVNLKQDVPQKAIQPFGFGVMPDYPISQNFADFMSNTDTELNYVLSLIHAASEDSTP